MKSLPPPEEFLLTTTVYVDDVATNSTGEVDPTLPAPFPPLGFVVSVI